MKQFTFGTFAVNDANRRAFEICRDVASLKPIHPQPVILLGDRGRGKTHLLYAIANCVRAANARTGIAYITANDFPARVRALVKDPVPVLRADAAVLLVDHLEEFADHLDELEAVVRLFVQHRHWVVLATSIHPGRLDHLPVGLRQLITYGQVVELGARDAGCAANRSRKETAESRPGPGSERSRGEAATLRAELDETRGQLRDARTELNRRRIVEQELCDLRREVAEARSEAARARREAGALLDRMEEMVRAVESSRDRFSAARAAQEKQLEEIRSLGAALACQGEEEPSLIALPRSLDGERFFEGRPSASTEDLERVCREREVALEALEMFRREVEEARQSYAEVQDSITRTAKQMGEIRRVAESVQRERDQARAEVESLRRERDASAEQARAATAEVKQLKEVLLQVRSEREMVKEHLRRAREQAERVEEENESLRQKLAAREAVSAKFDDVQERLKTSVEELDRRRKTSSHAAAELEHVQGELLRTAEQIERVIMGLKSGVVDGPEDGPSASVAVRGEFIGGTANEGDMMRSAPKREPEHSDDAAGKRVTPIAVPQRARPGFAAVSAGETSRGEGKDSAGYEEFGPSHITPLSREPRSDGGADALTIAEKPEERFRPVLHHVEEVEEGLDLLDEEGFQAVLFNAARPRRFDVFGEDDVAI